MRWTCPEQPDPSGAPAQGLAPFGEWEGETETRGLDGLAERCTRFRASGARFAKWRAALHIAGERGPSDAAVQRNAEQLAEYAAVCQVRCAKCRALHGGPGTTFHTRGCRAGSRPMCSACAFWAPSHQPRGLLSCLAR